MTTCGKYGKVMCKILKDFWKCLSCGNPIKVLH